jgi:DNA-binding NarL/FixJ family response regulator
VSSVPLPILEPAPIRILAVDDHPVVRRGIAAMIATQSDMVLVAEASNGREAIQQFRAHRPDITLMDLQDAGHERSGRAKCDSRRIS